MTHNWISNKRKPKKGGEYNVVWILDDGGYPTTTTMEYNMNAPGWTDPFCDNIQIDDSKILFWAHLPKPPKGIKKSIYQT